jgi:pyruvate dehydrogenase E2 component (dihydrolipoamide acetyltransferase)
MASNVLMPKMGYDMTEGKILRWIKNEGDAVTKGEPIAEIQTEKVNIEIEAFDSGVLAKILHNAGEDVPVGEAIGVIAQPGEKVEGPVAAAPAVAPSATKAQENGSAPAAALAPVVHRPGERVKASPLARKMAEERHLDLAAVPGTGPGGRVVRRDVEAFKGVPAAAPVARPAAVALAPRAADRKVDLSRMRQGIARRLSESKIAAPHFYVTKAIDMTAAIAFRSQLNAAISEEEKVSFNDLIVKAVAKACQAFPAVNASWNETSVIERGAVNVGVAVALPEGLVVPVLQDADQKNLPAIARETKEIIARARANKLRPDEMGGGTITVSNLGGFDVESFTAIINPPESAILAIGAIAKEPVVDEHDQIQIRSRMRITMSSDHRVIDGALAAQYLGEVKRLLERPILLLL